MAATCANVATRAACTVPTADATGLSSRSLSRSTWTDGVEGLSEVTDAKLLEQLQDMLTKTHKDHNAWTRDRGCTLHGVNGCGMSCAFKNKVKVPDGYKLVKAFRNQNAELWSRYSVIMNCISEDCSQLTPDVPYEPRSVLSQHDLDEELNANCNEWRLFHGTSWGKCEAICQTNFRVDMAGTGATWKADAASSKGVPLYGYGIYFAENITKADEYSGATFDTASGKDVQTVLVCRAIGGNSNLVTTNEIDKEKLWSDVFNGPHHSIFGDRVVELKKPYREFVVYDRDQVFPEFLLMYERL